jgi:hypothetical protein
LPRVAAVLTARFNYEYLDQGLSELAEIKQHGLIFKISDNFQTIDFLEGIGYFFFPPESILRAGFRIVFW